MTYKGDSDITFPYNEIKEIKTNYTLPTIDDIKRKKHMVAWFVSNCDSKRRLEYAKKLSKHIDVHIYGKCGNHTCERKDGNFIKNEVSEDSCYKMLERDYKFYLAFESNMCPGYVTEKMYNILQLNVIPIVMGNNEYDTLAPPRSVINVDEFNTPAALAQYLESLSNDTEMYLRFFEWKKDFVVTNNHIENARCNLCKKLNEPNQYQAYSDVQDWFYGFCYL